LQTGEGTATNVLWRERVKASLVDVKFTKARMIFFVAIDDYFTCGGLPRGTEIAAVCRAVLVVGSAGWKTRL
jgi:hypothetical protein